jgi:hypothetical protein
MKKLNFPDIKAGTPQFIHCGCCEHYHRVLWSGDCRDDTERFSTSDLEDKYGNEGKGWEEVYDEFSEEH